MKKSIMIAIDEDVHDALKTKMIKKSELINNLLKEWIKQNSID